MPFKSKTKLEKIAIKIAQTINKTLQKPPGSSNIGNEGDIDPVTGGKIRIPPGEIKPIDKQQGQNDFLNFRQNRYYQNLNKYPQSLPVFVRSFAKEYGYVNPSSGMLPKPKGQGYFTDKEIQSVAEQELLTMAMYGIFNDEKKLRKLILEKGIHPEDILAAGVILRLYDSGKTTPYNQRLDDRYLKRTGKVRNQWVPPNMALYQMVANDPDFDKDTLREILKYHPPPIPYGNNQQNQTIPSPPAP